MSEAQLGPTPVTGPRAAGRLIATRNFGPYFVGNALSASGDWFHNLAAAILVYRLTGSAVLLGVLGFVQFVPLLVLAPWAGWAADRFDRRRLLTVTQVAATALAASLAAAVWAGVESPALVIGVSLALGVVTAFSAPAAQALIGSLVAPRDLATAVGLNAMTHNLARAVGPALAGVTIAGLGIAEAFALNAVSYLALLVGVVVVRPRTVGGRTGGASLGDSLRLLRAEPRLAAFLLIVMLVGFASDPINTLAPAFAEEFGRPDTHAGFVLGVFGAGAVTAALLLAGRVAGSRRRMGVTLALLGGGVSLFALSPWLAVGLVALFVGGFGYLASNTSATSRLLLEIDEAQRGRMMALWTVAFLGLRPFASLVDGAIAGAWGVRTAGVVLAAPALAAAAAILVLDRRRYGRSRAPVAPEPSCDRSGAMNGYR